MSTDSIGRNAARLWQLMNDGTAWCYNKLKYVTQLSDRDLNAALGWLAREDSLETITDPASQEETYRVRHFWDIGGM